MPTKQVARRVLVRTLGPERARTVTVAARRRVHALRAATPTAPSAPAPTAPSAPTPAPPVVAEDHVDPDARRINIGGGRWTHAGWENVDHYVEGPEVHYSTDLRTNQKLPLPDGCARLLFTSHVLEHMDDAAASAVLGEARRLLAPGGTFRIAVPDARRALEAYQGGDELFFTEGGVNCLGATIERKLANFFASYRHDGYTGGPLVEVDEVRDAVSALELSAFIAWCVDRIPAEAEYKAHVNGYDFPKLAAMLRDAGFETVIRSAWRASRVPELRHANFDNRPVVSLFVEAY